jgi:hypothetical protein
MRRPRLWLGPFGMLALAGVPAPVGAQPVGEEFQINTYTTSQQRTGPRGGHLAAADASGNFVVVWSSTGQDGSGYGIFGQRYDSEGVTLGSEFRVNSFTTGNQRYASVAAAAGGDFVVVWSSLGQDGSGYGIFGQRYDAGGMAQGTEFRVNSFTASNQRFPSVAAAADGDFVVVWAGQGQGDSYGIFGQRYDSSGTALGSEFRVNSTTADPQQFPSVASDTSGNFVVAWGRPFGNYYTDILGQRYDSGGVARGNEFLIDHLGALDSEPAVDLSVASDASGNFVVVWRTYYGAILGQRYDSEGAALGGQFRVSTSAFGTSVASDMSGNFVVVWYNFQDGSSSGIFGQRYGSDGATQGDEFQINSYTTSDQRFPSAAPVATNQFVVAWESNGQDGNGFGVFGQRFAFPGGGAIMVESPNTDVRWRIGSLHNIQWTHNLGLAATFRIELDRDDDGVYEELIAAHADVESDTRGHFGWTVTGPPSGTARVRVSWTDDSGVSDSSDMTFQIRPAN